LLADAPGVYPARLSLLTQRRIKALSAPATRIYIAGPLGFSELGRMAQKALCDHVLAAGFVPVDPFALAPADQIQRINELGSLDSQRDAWRDLSFHIGHLNSQAIEACDAVLAVLDGPDVDSGTAAEIGYAHARAKRIVGYRGDFRLAADNIGSTVNLQVEYFIKASGGAIATSLTDLTRMLQAMSRPSDGA
jgi:nucleoside 2-deoxyribosyltransferase